MVVVVLAVAVAAAEGDETLMGRVAIARRINQPTGKKGIGHATCLGTSFSLALVGFGEESPPKTGGVRRGVLISLHELDLWS